MYFRIANQRVLELEARIEDMHDGQQEAITTAVATATAAAVAAAPPTDAETSKAIDLEKQLAELQTETSRVQTELDMKMSQLEEKTSQGADLSNKVTVLKKSVKELKDSLERKDDEMRAMEERYRRYLEKAKNVSETFVACHMLYRIVFTELCLTVLLAGRVISFCQPSMFIVVVLLDNHS